MRSLTLAAVVAPAAFAVMSLQTHMAFAQAAHRDDASAADWSTYNRNYAGDRYSPPTCCNPSAVTPTTIHGSRSSRMVLPMIAGSDP